MNPITEEQAQHAKKVCEEYDEALTAMETGDGSSDATCESFYLAQDQLYTFDYEYLEGLLAWREKAIPLLTMALEDGDWTKEDYDDFNELLG